LEIIFKGACGDTCLVPNMPTESHKAVASVTENVSFCVFGLPAKQGWQTQETFRARMDVFNRDLLEAKVQKPVILELDGHATRYSLDTFEFCLQNGM
jgi:hypothetical protein